MEKGIESREMYCLQLTAAMLNTLDLFFCVQVAALKNIGLNIRRAKLQAGAATGGGGSHKFYITDARKLRYLLGVC